MRSISKDIDVFKAKIWKTVKENIRYKSYMIKSLCPRQPKIINEIQETFKQNDLSCWTRNTFVFFADKKNFNQDQKVTWRNSRWIWDDPSNVPTKSHGCKNFSNSYGFKIVSNAGYVMPPRFFLLVNYPACIDVLGALFKLWIDKVRNGRV